jgi:hypothetical protein
MGASDFREEYGVVCMLQVTAGLFYKRYGKA